MNSPKFEAVISHGSGRLPPPRLISQSMRCERRSGGTKEFTLTFVIESFGDRVEATIAAVAGEPLEREKAGHLSIDFLPPPTENGEPSTANRS